MSLLVSYSCDHLTVVVFLKYTYELVDLQGFVFLSVGSDHSHWCTDFPFCTGSRFKLTAQSFWTSLLIFVNFFASGLKKCSSPILYMSCPRLGISHFFKEPLFLLMGMVLGNQNVSPVSTNCQCVGHFSRVIE